MKKRVLHVIDSLDLGGAQVVVQNLIRYADSSSFEHSIATLHGRGVFWDRLAPLGVELHSLSPQKWLPLYVPRLVALFAQIRPDIIHCHLLWANVLAKPLAALCGVPIRIHHDHCNDKATLAPIPRWLDAQTSRWSTHIIAVSESTRAGLLSLQGITPERVTTIHNGIDTTEYCPRPEQRATSRRRWGIPLDAVVVGGLGRLTYQKNFSLFIEIAAALCRKHPTLHFVIAGTGEEESSLRIKIEEHGLSNRIQLLGYVAEPSTLYSALDFLLLTSRYEGLPITVLEAMACGVPIVASDLDGIREVLRDRESAALLPPGMPEPFIARMDALLTEPTQASSFAQNALRQVQQRYSALAMTRAVEAVYARCLSQIEAQA